jgi:hypothetical protein
MTTSPIWDKVKRDAIGGGLPGMIAMGMQVSTLMWLRTTLNYQYRYGSTMSHAMRTLYQQGGIRRFYQGYTFAMIQAPLSRFGDTASNAGILTLMNNLPQTQEMPLAFKTACASITAGLFRILLMPVDTMKTILQVEGSRGWPLLKTKLQERGPSVLFHGAMATSLATLVGHYPWFLTYNSLNAYLPIPESSERIKTLSRSAFIGFTASMISDSISNSVRVVKTTRQTSAIPLSYQKTIQMILSTDGWGGLFGRGLKTKILTNGIQGLMFSVFWKMGQDYYASTEDKMSNKNR